MLNTVIEKLLMPIHANNFTVKTRKINHSAIVRFFNIFPCVYGKIIILDKYLWVLYICLYYAFHKHHN